MSDIAYDAVIETDFSFTFTPETGSAFGSAQCQIEEMTPAQASVEVVKYTPISGANAAKEQQALGKFPIQSVKFKATYKASEHAAALACLASRSPGTLIVTYGDGSIHTYAGAALINVTASSVTASSYRTDDLEFSCPMLPTFTE